MTDNRWPILRLNQVCKTYDLKGQQSIQALQNINLALYPGECLGIVGQSGSGKSSLAKCITQLEQVTSGEIWYRQQEVTRLKGEKLRQMRKQIQMVFQEPAAIFNPRMKVGRFISEPLLNYKLMKREQAIQEMRILLERVGLSAADADKYPHELSGGQQQRAVIARAIGLRPDVILYDEATSALDVSIQQQILDLLVELRRETGGASIFISHDLAVVQQVSDRIAIMHEGKVVEIVDSAKLTSSANHGYTRSLMSSALSLRAVRDRMQMQERVEVMAGHRNR